MALRSFIWFLDAGASETTTLKTIETVFGDNYKQVSKVGINNKSLDGQYSVTGKLPIVNAAYKFLLDHEGIDSFLLTISGETKTYKTKGTITKTHVSYDVWKLTFSLEQTFLP